MEALSEDLTSWYGTSENFPEKLIGFTNYKTGNWFGDADVELVTSKMQTATTTIKGKNLARVPT